MKTYERFIQWRFHNIIRFIMKTLFKVVETTLKMYIWTQHVELVGCRGPRLWTQPIKLVGHYIIWRVLWWTGKSYGPSWNMTYNYKFASVIVQPLTLDFFFLHFSCLFIYSGEVSCQIRLWYWYSFDMCRYSYQKNIS
jgi:hypothetical protein